VTLISCSAKWPSPTEPVAFTLTGRLV